MKCILCFCEHNNTWEGEPNMYCEKCVAVRQTARNKVDHIIGRLYLSDMQGAAGFEGFRICVHEDGPLYEGPCYRLPILTVKPKSKTDRSGAVASIEQLNDAAELIHMLLSVTDEEDKQDVLVHCYGGIERSPLTIAWYLVTKAKMFGTLQEAYNFLKQKRPAVSERLFWLPEDYSVLPPLEKDNK